MEFRILGPVEAAGAGGPARLPGSRQTALLSVLLLWANRAVPVGQLVDAVWPDRPPANATAPVQTYVFRLRRALAAVEPDADQRVVFTAAGYRLRVEPGELDLDVFRDHVRRGRGEAASGRPERAVTEIQAGLALWHGTALTGITNGYLEAQAVRLDEERLGAQEDRIDLELDLGRHADLVLELEDLAARHPVRERLHGQLMLALYRCGRQAEALQAFQHARQTLIDSLGVDPGPELRRIQHRILTGDAELAPPPPVPRRTGRNDLPGDVGDFTGRHAELKELLGALPGEEDRRTTAVVVEAIDGMAGVGKTALAVHAAHRLAKRYPDAQLFLDLHGHTGRHEAVDPMTALDLLLRAIGVPGERIPHEEERRAALWRAELAGQRAVVVLDNAASAAQVRSLLPGGAGCLTLITSRRRLLDLEGARALSLDVLPRADSVALFVSIVGDERITAEETAVTEVMDLCGDLPLAIRIAATRLRTRPAWTVTHLAERLRDRHRRLRELAAGDRGVAAAFSLSYQHLTGEQQRMFRLLGLHPGPGFDPHAAGSLAHTGPAEAEQLLEDLVDVHLLQEPAAGRYRFHELLRQHAHATAKAAESERERHDSLTRLADSYLRTAFAADRLLDPHRRQSGPPSPPTAARPGPWRTTPRPWRGSPPNTPIWWPSSRWPPSRAGTPRPGSWPGP